MRDSFSSPGIDPPSPTLSARLQEMAEYMAAPAAGRLTEEQLALALGIARRLAAAVAARLDGAIDSDSLWSDWVRGGIPGAEALAAPCFARAEEHRWREQSAQRGVQAPLLAADDDADHAPLHADDPLSAVDRAYLALQIADRRRFDAVGNPCLAIADIDLDLFRSLLLDVAAWRLVQTGRNPAAASALGESVRTALSRHMGETGIDRAATAYHDAAVAAGTLTADTIVAVERHDWPTLLALAAAAHGRLYSDMALALLTAGTAALPSLLAPLRVERAALAALEASLAMLPGRAVTGGDAASDDYAAMLQSRAAMLGAPTEDFGR